MRPGYAHELRRQTRVVRKLFLQNGAWSKAGVVFVPHCQNGVSDGLTVLKEEKGARGKCRQVGNAAHHEILAQAPWRNGGWQTEVRLDMRQVLGRDDRDLAMVGDFCTLPESVRDEELLASIDEPAARVTIASDAVADQNFDLGDGG